VTRDEPWLATLEGVVVVCRLTPKGGRDSIDGIARLTDGTSVLLARVRKAPEDGRANDALCSLLAEKLGAPRSRVSLIAGARSRLKQVAVSGDPDALIARLRRLVVQERSAVSRDARPPPA
jgi:uncharacterized protein YggU (UPF0235/DUF167 family)